MSTNIEYHAHGPAHFAFGGTGGVEANSADELLVEKFGWDDTDLMALAWSTHHNLKNAFKQFYESEAESPMVTAYLLSPTMPAADPKFGWDWDKLNANDGAYVKSLDNFGNTRLMPNYEKLEKIAEEKGITVEAAYWQYFFVIWGGAEGSFNTKLYEKAMAGNFTDAEYKAMNTIISQRMPIEGDVATSGASLDPLFWMLHGEVFRMLHRIIFEDAMESYNFTTVSKSCEGHSSLGQNPWLKGFKFSEAGTSRHVAVEEVSNKDLASYLHPLSSDFDDKFDFIFDAADYTWCPAFNQAFKDYAKTGVSSVPKFNMPGTGGM